jgi:hypothetical protein
LPTKATSKSITFLTRPWKDVKRAGESTLHLLAEQIIEQDGILALPDAPAEGINGQFDQKIHPANL